MLFVVWLFAFNHTYYYFICINLFIFKLLTLLIYIPVVYFLRTNTHIEFLILMLISEKKHFIWKTRVPRSEMTALKPDFLFKWQESTFRVFVNAILKLLKYCSKVKMKCKYFSRHEQTLCYVLNACIYMNNNNI